MKNNKYSFDKLTKVIINEQKKIPNPSINDISTISKKLNVDKDIVREALGYKDEYDFVQKIND